MPSSRSLWLAVVLLTTSVGLAGCTGGEQASAPNPIAATTAVETARTSATQWQPDATLILLSGTEASEGSKATREIPTDDGTEQRTWPDSNVGDGRAPEWTVRFYSATENQTRGYQVSTNNVENLGGTPPSQTPQTLTNWTVDSPEAIGIAFNNASFREAALQTDSVLVMTLGIRDGSPVWHTVARSGSSGAHAQILIDASNGTILDP